jgi:hypothetical protein
MQHLRHAWIDGRIAESQKYANPGPERPPLTHLVAGCHCEVCLVWEQHKKEGSRLKHRSSSFAAGVKRLSQVRPPLRLGLHTARHKAVMIQN